MWKANTCEVCGVGHKRLSLPCQDKTFSCSINGIDVVALSDGAGSAKMSHFGAERITKSICSYVGENFSLLVNNPNGQEVKKNIIDFLMSELEDETKKSLCEMKDLSATLLLVAVDENSFFVAHVGDGVIGYLKGDEIKIVSMPQNGEFINTTTFITSSEAISRMEIYKGSLDKISGFVLMSDGTAESLFDRKTKSLATSVLKIMSANTLLQQEKMQILLKDTLEQVFAKKTQDDCSIAVLTRYSDVLRKYSDMSASDRAVLLQELLGLSANSKKSIARYDLIINRLIDPKMSLKEISQLVDLKEKYTRKIMNNLVRVGLIWKQGDFYLGFE